MARAWLMTCGLYISGSNGPNTGTLRAARNSSAAFFCSSVYLPGAIVGRRVAPNAFAATTSANRASSGVLMKPPWAKWFDEIANLRLSRVDGHRTQLSPTITLDYSQYAARTWCQKSIEDAGSSMFKRI